MTKSIYIQDIFIENYKSFKRFEAKGFGKINLITGKNNAGKTSLLESLFINLGPANTTLPINILGRIGLNRMGPEGSSNINFLFNRYDMAENIKFIVSTKNHGNTQLDIKLRDATPDEVSLINTQSKTEDSISLGSFKTLEYKLGRKNKSSLINKLLISSTGIIPLGEPVTLYPESVFISSELTPSSSNEIERYDFINKAELVDKFEGIIRIIEPKLKRTSLGINNSAPILLADVGYGLAPLNLLGSGGKKLSQIFLALAYAKNAVVMIDEIEGSFHYSILNEIWKAIIGFAKDNETQVFATTHSSECLVAAYKSAQELNFDDFLIHRLEKGESQTNFFTFRGQELSALLENDWEMR